MPGSASLFPEETAKTGWVTAHCDGGARGNPGPAGYGAVLQDEAGQVLAELSEFLGHRTNNYALDHRCERLRVISDSLLMVKQIQGKFKVASADLKPLWEEARRRISRLDGFEIEHALRHKNKVADRLANDAMDRGTNTRRTPAANASPLQSTEPKPGALRGFTRDGAIHLLGNATLPDGVFVKVIPE
jgi:ribonuclease HI